MVIVKQEWERMGSESKSWTYVMSKQAFMHDKNDSMTWNQLQSNVLSLLKNDVGTVDQLICRCFNIFCTDFEGNLISYKIHNSYQHQKCWISSRWSEQTGENPDTHVGTVWRSCVLWRSSPGNASFWPRNERSTLCMVQGPWTPGDLQM